MSAGGLMQGTAWMVAMRWVIRLIGLVNSMIIARLLLPADFGLMALAMIAIDLCITAVDGDIDMALIRSQDLSRAHYDTGWSLKIIGGGLVFVALFLAAPLIASLCGEPRLTLLIRVAAVRPLILGFENIAVIDFRRRLDFAREFRYLVAQKLVSFGFCLAIIWLLRSALALALCAPCAALVTVALSYRMAPPQGRFDLTKWREFWSFSRWQILFNLSRQWGERIDPFAITRWGDLTQTGLYAIGFDLALLPTREIMMPAGRALMPAYARMNGDGAALRQAFATNLQLSLLVGAGCGVGLSCVAEDAVVTLFGEPWRAAAPWLAWLGLFGALEGVWLMLDPLLIACGEERLLGLANLGLALLLSASCLIAASQFGITWVPLGRLVAVILALAAILTRLTRLGWLEAGAIWSGCWRPALASALMALAIKALHLSDAGSLTSLLHDISVGAISFFLADLALWRLAGAPAGAEQSLIGMVRRREQDSPWS